MSSLSNTPPAAASSAQATPSVSDRPTAHPSTEALLSGASATSAATSAAAAAAAPTSSSAAPAATEAVEAQPRRSYQYNVPRRSYDFGSGGQLPGAGGRRRSFQYGFRPSLDDMRTGERDARLSVEFVHRSVATGEARERRAAALALQRPLPEPEKEYKHDVETDLHLLSPEELATRLRTHAGTGLIDEEAQQRLRQYGPNALAVYQKHWIKNWIRYLFGGFGYLLWPASLLCFLSWRPLGNPPEAINLGLGVLILIVIALQAGFTWFQEHQSSKVMASIKQLLPSNARVIRSGAPREVPCEELVPGDVILLSVGMRVPADCVLVDVQDLKIDQAALTGESVPISRTVGHTHDNPFESRNVVFMGTNVAEGGGKAIITATGNATAMGKIARLASETKEVTTRLSREINWFLILASAMALTLGALVLILWLAWLRTSHRGFLSFTGALVAAIATCVSFVPEGMPVGFTLALTIVARRMARNSVLVKQLATVETLGSVDLIASDKTGTLTQNRMTVVNLFLPGGAAVLPAEDAPVMLGRGDLRIPPLALGVTLCCGAQYGQADEVTKEKPVLGDATDAAVLRYSEQFWDAMEKRNANPQVAKLPFNSRNKYMMTLHRLADHAQTQSVMVYLKGAAERIVERCSQTLDEQGRVIPLTQEIRARIAAQQEAFGAEGERVLGICQRLLNEAPYTSPDFVFNTEKPNFPCEDMTFLGLIGIMDPPRPEVKESIAKCQTAGVRVTMVTGDHPTTAVSIARQIGIITLPVTHTIKDKPPGERPEALEKRDLVRERQLQFMLGQSRPASSDNSGNRDVDLEAIGDGSAAAWIASVHDKAVVVTGAEIPQFDDATWSWVYDHTELVFARTSPEQKLTIVKEAQKRKHAVAVTGDGINDAAALKQADVGVAMGSGSDVAREAARLVLLTDDFGAVVYGIEQGRNFYQNLKKLALFFLPAGCFSELLPNLFLVLLGLPVSLNAFEMIYICVITDMFPSLSLIYEQPEADMMRQPPRKRSDRLVSGALLAHVFFFYGLLICFGAFFCFFFYMWHWAHVPPSGLFLAFQKFPTGPANVTDPATNITTPVLYYGQNFTTLNEHLYVGQSVYFVALVSQQFFCLNAIRTRRQSFLTQRWWSGPTRNLWVPAAVLASAASLLIAVYVPFFNSVFNTRHVPWQFWLLPWAFGLLLLTLDELRKYCIRRWPRGIISKIAW